MTHLARLPHQLLLATAFTCALAAPLSAQVFLDFNGSGDVAANTRNLSTDAAYAFASDSSGNGYIKGTTGSFAYDANGSTAGVSNFAVSQGNPLTVSFKISAQGGISSIGIYIINNNTANPNTPTSAYLTLININPSGANDRVRFWDTPLNPTTNPGTNLVDGSLPNNSVDFIATEPAVEAGVLPFATTATLVYSINVSNEPVLTLSLTGGPNNASSTYTLTGATAFTDVQVGIRLNGGGNAMRMDNLSITSVPEPGAATLLAILGGGLFLVRRRRSA